MRISPWLQTIRALTVLFSNVFLHIADPPNIEQIDARFCLDLVRPYTNPHSKLEGHNPETQGRPERERVPRVARYHGQRRSWQKGISSLHPAYRTGAMTGVVFDSWSCSFNLGTSSTSGLVYYCDDTKVVPMVTSPEATAVGEALHRI